MDRIVWGQHEPNPAENVDICFSTMEVSQEDERQKSKVTVRNQGKVSTEDIFVFARNQQENWRN